MMAELLPLARVVESTPTVPAAGLLTCKAHGATDPSTEPLTMRFGDGTSGVSITLTSYGDRVSCLPLTVAVYVASTLLIKMVFWSEARTSMFGSDEVALRSLVPGPKYWWMAWKSAAYGYRCHGALRSFTSEKSDSCWPL